ncbi:ras GEF [Phlegmacium glaucopus]|nr:ras GEF [Phlegmacium glaucopus]
MLASPCLTRKTSGRTQPWGKKPARIVGYPEFILSSAHVPPTPKSPNYAQPQKPETVFSDKAAVAYAIDYTPANLHSSLSTIFPSICATTKTLSFACKSKELQEYLAASEIFLNCVVTIVDQMQGIPPVDHYDCEFLSKRASLVFVGGYFIASVSNLKAVERRQVEDRLNESYEYVRLLYDLISDLLGATIRSTFKTKPLPELPPEATLQAVEESQSTLETPTSSNSCISSLEEADELTTLIDIHVVKDKDSKHKISWKIPKRFLTLGSSKYPPFNFKSIKSLTSKSSATLVQPDVIDPVKLSFRADIEPSRPPSPPTPNGGIRHSIFFYPNDPLNPESDVAMPMPTGEAAALSIDAEGRIKGGSLPALVAILTSRQGVTDHELSTTVYTYFRCFATPMLLFQELTKRYKEPPPTNLTDNQACVWETNTSIVRIRVAKAILDWLNQYWRAESDDEILEDMLVFAEERVKIHGHPAILLRVIEKVKHMKQVSPEDALTKRAQELVARVELMMPQKPATPTGFIFPERFSPNLVAQLQQFNSSAGREEFARQLTMKLSSMFRDVDPVDAVAFWRLSEKNQKNDATINLATSKAIKAIAMFERSLTIWISYCIVKPIELLDRARMASFWLDIATICLRLRNFNSARCIFGGVAQSSVTRMKETILNVPIASKAQYRHLDCFFSGHGNYAQYREAMERPMTPTLPFTAPFVHDVIVADTLASLAEDEEDRKRTYKGSKSQITVTETENIKYIHLSRYRIMMQTIRTLDNYLIPYKFDKNEHFQTWLDAQLNRFTFSNPEEEDTIYRNIYDRSTKREPKNKELQLVRDVWEKTILGSPNGPYSITRCSEETLQLVPQASGATSQG